MPVVFPPIETATEEGLVAVGGSLDFETLFTAYSQGIFPWPVSKDSPMTWFCPDPRGILPPHGIHNSKSYIKFLKRCPFTIKFNSDFKSVILGCANTLRPTEVGTWIDQDIIDGFYNFFELGHAYCVEVYHDQKLVGGLYGVCIGHYITGESMFHLETGASKVALSALCTLLNSHKIPLLDTQMVTPIIESFGGIKIPRNKFLSDVEVLTKIPVTRDEIFNRPDLSIDQLLID